MTQWNYSWQTVEFVENLFLINYLLDGVLRVNIVGKDIFLYPSIVIFDLIFPLFIYALFTSGLILSNNLRYSTFFFLRFINPDRYLRVNFLRRGNIIIRTIVNSIIQQLYLCVILAFLILFYSQIGITLFRDLNFNLLIFEPSQTPYYFSSLIYTIYHLTSTAFTDNYDTVTSMMRIRNEFCLKADPYHRYYLIAEREIVDAVDSKLYLHTAEQNATHLNRQTLILCDVNYDYENLNFYLNFTFNPDQTKHLMSVIISKCKQDVLMSKSKLLNCDFDRSDYMNKIKHTYTFRNKVNSALRNSFSSTDSHIYLTFERVKQISSKKDFSFDDSDQFYDYLNNFCNQLTTTDRYSILNYYDPRRYTDYSKIANWMNLEYLSLFQLIMSNSFTSKFSLNKICSKDETIKLYYLIFFILTKLIILNILKAILFKQYSLERLRDQNNLFNLHIQEFINCWRSFEDTNYRMDSEKLIHNHQFILDHLPIDYVLIFLKNHCPIRFRLQEELDEDLLYVLSKYSIKLNCFNENNFKNIGQIKFQMHLLDVLSICIAVQMNCRLVYNFYFIFLNRS